MTVDGTVRSVLAPIVVVGSSGHARVVLDIVHSEGRYEVIGLVDSYRAVGESALGCTILGGIDQMGRLFEERQLAGYLIAVGDNFARGSIADEVGRAVPAIPLVSAVHPRALIARDAIVGPGTVAMAGAIVNPGAQVGRCCILNTNASLDHDAVMDDYSSLAPGAAVGGNVHVGAFSAIGIGASVVHRVRIGTHVVVGAGAAVIRDVDDLVIVVGVPARPISSRRPGDKYL
jgi:sugar O-acyltransferase (sialic acid O-acetyltransferase NeuD family)